MIKERGKDKVGYLELISFTRWAYQTMVACMHESVWRERERVRERERERERERRTACSMQKGKGCFWRTSRKSGVLTTLALHILHIDICMHHKKSLQTLNLKRKRSH